MHTPQLEVDINTDCYNAANCVRQTVVAKLSSCWKGRPSFRRNYASLNESTKQHGRNLVGDTGDVSPHFFLFRFCIWRGFKNNSDVRHVLCEELFILDGWPHTASSCWNRVWCDIIDSVILHILASIK